MQSYLAAIEETSKFLLQNTNFHGQNLFTFTFLFEWSEIQKKKFDDKKIMNP